MSLFRAFLLLSNLTTEVPSIRNNELFQNLACNSTHCCMDSNANPPHCCPRNYIPHPEDSTLCCQDLVSGACCPKPFKPFNPGNFYCCQEDYDGKEPTPAEPKCCVGTLVQFSRELQCCRTSPNNIFNTSHCCPLPSFPSQTQGECCLPGSTNDCCQLPLLPSGVKGNTCCMIPGNDKEIVDKDGPPYDLKSPTYISEMSPKDTVYSEFQKCSRDAVIQTIFDNGSFDADTLALLRTIPTDWSPLVSLREVLPPKILAETFSSPDKVWPEIVLPFLLPIMVFVTAVLAVIPIFLIGALGWAILFNLRFLGHRKIRMFIRSMLIRMEKYRRWKYEWSFPKDHLRKFRQRDRYQLPKAFQDSEVSGDDDEPEELEREEIPRKETSMYTPEEIEKYGYDPSNIPMEWIYGDLLGNPSALAKEVRQYLRKKPKRGRGGAGGVDKTDDYDRVSLKSDEVAAFLGRTDYVSGGGKEGALPAVWDTKKITDAHKKRKLSSMFTRKQSVFVKKRPAKRRGSLSTKTAAGIKVKAKTTPKK